MSRSIKHCSIFKRFRLYSGFLIALVILLGGAAGVQALEGKPTQTCQGDDSWIEGHIDQLRGRLIAEGKNCQLGGIYTYQSCLAQQVAVGACQPEAIEYCAAYLEDIIAMMPIDPPGGSGLEGNTSYAWKVDEMTFSYEGRGGSASGTMHMLTETLIDHCNYAIDIAFTGSFEYETCSFQGTGSYSWTCQVNPEVGGKCLLCGEDGEIAGMPGTWTAELKDNEIRGSFEAVDKQHVAGFRVKLDEPGDYRDINLSGFRVNLICAPARPAEEQEVACSATLYGKQADEEVEYRWYLDSAKEAETKDGSWTWASVEKGVHDITVFVQGDGRDTESTITIEVGEELELVASIGLDPPVPVVEQGVTFTPRVEGAKANETLSYRWFLDKALLCETAMCTWGEALEGSHLVQLEVRGEGERLAVKQRQFDVVNLVDEEKAGFRIVGLGCNSGVSSDETLTCSLGLERDEDIGPLNVTWLIDGLVASTEAGVEAGSDMQLGQPAPGEHAVNALVVDPVSGYAISGQTVAEVIEGKNALIPPLAQAGAAGGTLGLVGVWLWAEWLNARRAEAEEARLRQLQKPSWVDDKRSLEEIWAADVEAERQRRGLWGFEYNKETGIFKQPDWTYSGSTPWWWGDSDKAFQRQRQAWQDARGDLKLRADRSLEQEWLREIYQEPSAAKRLKSDWIYKPEIDAWERASYHREEIAKQNRALLLKTDRAIDAMLDKLPVSQWGKVEALQEKILAASSPNGEDLSRMLRLRGAVYNLQQAQFDAEAAGAMHDAAWAQLGEEAVSNVRAGAAGVSLAITLTWLLAGAAGLAGLAGASELTATISGAMMKLGAFRLTMNLVEGATVGYLEGGFNAAVVGGMKRTLPINTMSLYLGPRMPGDRDPGWKRIGFSVLQDLGNAFTLKHGLAQYKQLAQRAGASISNAYQRLTGVGDQSLRMPPVKDGEIARINTEWWAERERGQRLVNNFNQVRLKLQSATDQATRVRLSNQLTRQAIRINESYAAKSILKVVNKPGLSRAFDNRIQRIYRVVDHRVAKQLSVAGFTRGGRAISRTDFTNFRNATSAGTVGMDRDVGLNQMLEQKWAQVVREATPGTEWHAHAVAKLRAAQKASQLARQGGRVSYSTFQHEADRLYKEAYHHVTGASATKSSQVLTGPMHPEAYADPHALLNNPVEAPFSVRWAGQTGSVSALKVHENFQMVNEGAMKFGNAVQESARGLAKDIGNKLIPFLKARPGGAPVELTYWQAIHKLLDQGGKGNIRPGELLETLGGKDGIIRLAEQTSAGIQGAIQSR